MLKEIGRFRSQIISLRDMGLEPVRGCPKPSIARCEITLVALPSLETRSSLRFPIAMTIIGDAASWCGNDKQMALCFESTSWQSIFLLQQILSLHHAFLKCGGTAAAAGHHNAYFPTADRPPGFQDHDGINAFAAFAAPKFGKNKGG
jgi:hypothetical protein